MRLTVRRLIGFVIFLVVALWFGLRVYQERSIEAIQGSLEVLSFEAARNVDEISELDAALREYHATWRKALADTSPKLRKGLLESRTSFEASLKRAGEVAHPNPNTASKIHKKAEETDRLSKIYFENTRSLLEGRMLTAALDSEIEATFQQLLQQTNELRDFFEDIRVQSVQQSSAVVKKLRNQDLVLLFVSLSGMLILSFFIWFVIGSPLMQLSLGMNLIQANRWIDPLPEKGFGEIADLIRNFNGMAETLSVQKHLLEKQATTDELTGLMNFRSFQERMVEELERAKRSRKPLTLIIADIDHFKKYNDTKGHLAGNEALKQIAHHMREGCRPYDLVARFGGEEFAVVLPETTREDGIRIAERVRAFAQSGAPLTLSCGIATFPQDADTLQALVAQADKRLYQAKDAGRNRICA